MKNFKEYYEETMNEGYISFKQSKLSNSFQEILYSELANFFGKKNVDRFSVKGKDLYFGDDKLFKVSGDMSAKDVISKIEKIADKKKILESIDEQVNESKDNSDIKKLFKGTVLGKDVVAVKEVDEYRLVTMKPKMLIYAESIPRLMKNGMDSFEVDEKGKLKLTFIL